MCIYTGDNTLILRETMKDLEKRLDPRRFQRVHRSCIVNLDQVRQVKPHTNGECFLVLESGSAGEGQPFLSRRRRAVRPLILIALSALQATAAAQPAPDIQLNLDANIRRVTIERSGEASLEVTGGEGSLVRVEAPPANGRTHAAQRRPAGSRRGAHRRPQNPPAAETAAAAMTLCPRNRE